MNPPQLNADTEALLQGYLEGTLTPVDSTRLLTTLRSQPELIGVLLDGLRMDALIRQVVSQTAAATSTGSTTLLPERASAHRSRQREEADRPAFSRLKSASSPRRLRPPWNRPIVLALAASVVFLVGLAAWYFGPTVGLPELAEIKGDEVTLERGTEFVPAANGMALQSADVLRVGKNASATIAFGAEPTRLALSAGSELKLTSFISGKRFVLQVGQIEAAVARQRPFQPMLITTPQAEARVLGTRFTLTVTTNATRLDVTEGEVRFTRASDGASVKVATDRYAVAAINSELAALPRTGGLLCEWWRGVKGPTILALNEDPRFPRQPDGWAKVPDFALTLAETNQFGVRLSGYLHPPVTGDYEFWLESSVAKYAYANLLMSRSEDRAETVLIARTGSYSLQSPSPFPLVAGRRYFVEMRILIPSGGAHFSIAWKPPGSSRQLLTGKFLSPYTTK